MRRGAAQLALYRIGIASISLATLGCHALSLLDPEHKRGQWEKLWLCLGMLGQFLVMLLCFRAKEVLIECDEGLVHWNYSCVMGMVVSYTLMPYNVIFVRSFLAFGIICWLILCQLTPQVSACIALRIGIILQLTGCVFVIILYNNHQLNLLEAATCIPYSLSFLIFFLVHTYLHWGNTD